MIKKSRVKALKVLFDHPFSKAIQWNVGKNKSLNHYQSLSILIT